MEPRGLQLRDLVSVSVRTKEQCAQKNKQRRRKERPLASHGALVAELLELRLRLLVGEELDGAMRDE